MLGAMRSASIAMTPGVTAACNGRNLPVIADMRPILPAQHLPIWNSFTAKTTRRHSPAGRVLHWSLRKV